VILAHGLGTNRYAVDFREGRSLARALRDAGFAVYLLEHRAHASAVPPADGSRAFDFDDIAALDLPAAVDAVLEHSGFSRAHWVGHAMGGQLLYGLLAHCRGDGIAAAVSLCAPVRFAARPSTTGAIRVLRHLLPRGARLPIRLTAAALSPAARGGARTCAEPAYARGVLVHATEDISGAMMRQVLQWLQSGALCDRHDRLDYAEALRGLDTPLMVLASQGDPLCPPEHAIPALDGLVGPTAIEILGAEWAHFDVLLHARAADAVYPRIVSWLDQHRRLAWES
jgi:predicted alpha/beta hydrolase